MSPFCGTDKGLSFLQTAESPAFLYLFTSVKEASPNEIRQFSQTIVFWI